MAEQIAELLGQLDEDVWRRKVAFSEDIETVNRVLFHPYASKGEKERALALWLQGKGNQPCLFGRIAAVDSLHICLLDDATLNQSNDAIREKLHSALLDWKRGSLDPTRSRPAHGLVVALVSPKLAFAAPNKALLRFVRAFRELWGCEVEKDAVGNDVALETLFLRKPGEQYLKFTFSVDYFGAQGDGRWWHDHRFPGGLAFTANSAGHMIHTREAFGGKKEQVQWLLQTAMLTIDESKETSFGRATWLRELVDGRPFVASACPFTGERKVRLEGKDWTRYGGHLYSDHSIREEFFRDQPEKPEAFLSTEWLEDFVYLYEEGAADHARFVRGEPISREAIVQVLGEESTWRTVVPLKGGYLRASGQGGNPEVAEALRSCEGWQLSPVELAEISES